MNLRKTLFSAFAALALSASVMAPVALAGTSPPGDDDSTTNSDSTTVKVNVVAGGVFDVYFSNANINLGTTTLNSSNLEKDVPGTIRIGYTDTKAYRPNFDLTITASDFSDGNGNFIDAAGFTVEKTDNVIQQHYGGPGRCDSPPNSGNLDPNKVANGCNPNVDIGDLGYFVNDAYTSQDVTGGVWTTKTYDIESSPTVHFGYAGAGTGVSYGDVHVNLHIPNTTVGGEYQTVVTFSIFPGTQPGS